MSKGKTKTDKTETVETTQDTPRYNIGGVAFRIINEDELTGERWDKSMPLLRRLDSTNFAITSCKWHELIEICSAILVSCDDIMSIDKIKAHLTESKDLTISMMTLLIAVFCQSNGSWLGLLETFSQAKTAAIQEAVRQGLQEMPSGQQKS